MILGLLDTGTSVSGLDAALGEEHLSANANNSTFSVVTLNNGRSKRGRVVNEKIILPNGAPIERTFARHDLDAVSSVLGERISVILSPRDMDSKVVSISGAKGVISFSDSVEKSDAEG